MQQDRPAGTAAAADAAADATTQQHTPRGSSTLHQPGPGSSSNNNSTFTSHSMTNNSTTTNNTGGSSSDLPTPGNNSSSDADAMAELLVLALHVAARSGDAVALEQLLSEVDVPIDAQNEKGLRALHMAAGCGHVAAVRVLLAHGATVDAQTPEECAAGRLTALQMAVLGTGTAAAEVVEVLLDAGAQRDMQTALLVAIKHGRAEIVDVLLRGGAEPNCRATSITSTSSLLAMAVSVSTPAIVEVLLQAGAVGREEDGSSDALLAACHRNLPDMLRLLLQHTQQHTPAGLRQLLKHALRYHRFEAAAQLLLQLESEQDSAADSIISGLGVTYHNPAALRLAVLKGWASDTTAVDAGHKAAAAQEQEVAAQRVGVQELAVGLAVADMVAEEGEVEDGEGVEGLRASLRCLGIDNAGG